MDRLNIVAHDRFQEIVDEANKPDSTLRLQAVVVGAEDLAGKIVTLISQSRLEAKLGLQPEQMTCPAILTPTGTESAFATSQGRKPPSQIAEG